MKKQKILVVSDTHKMHVNFDLAIGNPTTL